MRENICGACGPGRRDESHLCERCDLLVRTWLRARKEQTTHRGGRRIATQYLGRTDGDGGRYAIRLSTAHLEGSHLYVVDAYRERITPNGMAVYDWEPDSGKRLATIGVKRFSAKRLEAIHAEAVERVRLAPFADELRGWMAEWLAGPVRESVSVC